MTIGEAAAWIGYAATFGGAVIWFSKIWKQIKAICDGQKCQLRNDITGIYYRHNEEEKPTLREHEHRSLDELYEGYKALNGDSYVDDIYKTMRSWRVVT